MRIIYVDSGHKCHVQNDGTMTPIETNFFDGKCDDFVEGWCYEIESTGTAIYSWKPYEELATAQQEYERQLLSEYEKALAEIEAALGV